MQIFVVISPPDAEKGRRTTLSGRATRTTARVFQAQEVRVMMEFTARDFDGGEFAHNEKRRALRPAVSSFSGSVGS